MSAPTSDIDLGQPFEHVLEAVLSLPPGSPSPESSTQESELRNFLRGLYEAANGRQVETVLGLIPIAPPVASFLKAAPFPAATQIGFLIDAANRVLYGPNHSTRSAAAQLLNHND